MKIHELFTSASTIEYMVIAEPKLLQTRFNEDLTLNRLLELFGPFRGLQYLLLHKGNTQFNKCIFNTLKSLIFQIGVLLPKEVPPEITAKYDHWVATFNFMQLAPHQITRDHVLIIDEGCDFFFNPANGWITEEQLSIILRHQLPPSIWANL